MKLSKIAATAAMTGALGSAALGIGAGFAQADPDRSAPRPERSGAKRAGSERSRPGWTGSGAVGAGAADL